LLLRTARIVVIAQLIVVIVQQRWVATGSYISPQSK